MPKADFDPIAKILKEKRTYVLHQTSGPFRGNFLPQPLGRLMYPEKGVLHIRTADRILLVPSRYCAWIPAGTAHEVWSNSKECFLRNIYFDSAFCKNPQFHRLAIFNASALFRQMMQYTEKWNRNQEKNLYEQSFVTVIRQMIPEEMQQAFQVFLRSSGEENFQKLLEYIDQHYAENLRLTDLQKQAPYSLRTLQRLFEIETGLSFSSYLKTIRVLKAIELLSEGTRRVSEVAWEVGYSSLPTFSTTFREATGLTPDHFLKSRRGQG